MLGKRKGFGPFFLYPYVVHAKSVSYYAHGYTVGQRGGSYEARVDTIVGRQSSI